MVHSTNKKKWFVLSVVGTALLLIPRRSSRKGTTLCHEQSITNHQKERTDSCP